MKNTFVLILLFTSINLFSQNGNFIEMVFVEGGMFTMGCTNEQDSDCSADEKPTHQVTLNNFYIGKYEITQKQWKTIMKKMPKHLKIKGDNLPVTCVSWDQAVEFCNKLSKKEGRELYYNIKGKNITINSNANGYRLPTEEEWEYACRGGKYSANYKYSGSNNIDDVAWYASNSDRKPHEVGTKQPNELGIYDMSGNENEWCYNWISNYSIEKQENPQESENGKFKVLRGGSYWTYAYNCRVFCRYSIVPINTYWVSLRVVIKNF